MSTTKPRVCADAALRARVPRGASCRTPATSGARLSIAGSRRRRGGCQWLSFHFDPWRRVAVRRVCRSKQRVQLHAVPLLPTAGSPVLVLDHRLRVRERPCEHAAGWPASAPSRSAMLEAVPSPKTGAGSGTVLGLRIRRMGIIGPAGVLGTLPDHVRGALVKRSTQREVTSELFVPSIAQTKLRLMSKVAWLPQEKHS